MDDMAANPMTFRDVIARAASDHADRYVGLMLDNGYTGPESERFRRVVARIFVDAVMWTLAGDIHITASNLIELDQIEAVIAVHQELSALLYDAGVRVGNNTPGGDRAGQDDPRTRP
jgi:hypothetical protein